MRAANKGPLQAPFRYVAKLKSTGSSPRRPASEYAVVNSRLSV